MHIFFSCRTCYETSERRIYLAKKILQTPPNLYLNWYKPLDIVYSNKVEYLDQAVAIHLRMVIAIKFTLGRKCLD